MKNANEQFEGIGVVIFEVAYRIDSKREYKRFDNLKSALGAIRYACKLHDYVRVFSVDDVHKWGLVNALVHGESMDRSGLANHRRNFK